MFKWREPSRPRSNTCKNIRSEIKRPNDGDRTLPRKLLIEVALGIPHPIQDITIALGCLPELDGRTLVMKKPQILATRGEIKLVLITPLPLC